MKLTKEQRIKLNEVLRELKTLKYAGEVDFIGLENREGFKVTDTINNRLEKPIKIIEEILK